MRSSVDQKFQFFIVFSRFSVHCSVPGRFLALSWIIMASKMPPRRRRSPPRRLQERQRRFQNGHKSAPRQPKRPLDVAQEAPRISKRLPQRPRRAPDDCQEAPRGLQEDPTQNNIRTSNREIFENDNVLNEHLRLVKIEVIKPKTL